MRIIHFINWAINRSGLCMCALEQVKYERRLGIDSQVAIFETEFPRDDWVFEGIKPITWEETKDADLFVIHRGLPGKLEDLKKPNIMIIHGTAEFLMLEELFSNAEKTPFNTHINLIKNCDASVAVNQHDYDIYKLYDPTDKLVMIHDAIDMERFTIEGHQYPFNHHPQILFCDSLRPNKYPSHAIWTMAEVKKNIPEARLTVVGLDLLGILTWRNLILRSPGNHLAANIENIQLLTNDNSSFMRGADIVINGNMSGIPSRTELESMACGCQVISYGGNFTKWIAKPFDIKSIAEQILNCWNEIKDRKETARQEARQWVLDNASMEVQVHDKYIPLYHKVLKLDK